MSSATSKKFMYDLCVIGAGSGGVRAARISGGHGAKVALVELSAHHGPPTYTAAGGTCVNVGCVPKKLMVYGSHYAQYRSDSKGFGWGGLDEANATHSWKTLMDNKNKEITRLNGIYGKMLGNAGVDMIIGKGFLKPDGHTVTIATPEGGSREISAETILVCTGGWPFRPSVPGAEHGITSNEAFYLEDRPESILVVGGGYIAVEFAAIFHGYGTKVSLFHRGSNLLRGFDDDVVAHLYDEMVKEKIDMHMNTQVASIVKLDNGKLEVTNDKGDKAVYDQVMWATGRRPLTSGLGLEEAGVKLGPNGVVPVNELSKTNVDHIYAVGDVTDRMALTPVALMEGHCLADTLYGKNGPRSPDHENVASAVFSNPEIGTVGLTEAQAVTKYKNVKVFTSTFTPLMHKMTGRDTKAFMKILVSSNDDKVVGVHMCGDHAGEIMQGIAIAVKMGATKADFDRTIGIHPTSAEEFVTMRSHSYEFKDGAKL